MNTWWIYSLFFYTLISGIEKKTYGQTNTVPHSVTLTKVTVSSNKKVADSLFNLGSTYQDSLKYQQSLALLETSLRLYQLIGDEKKIGDCFNYMAINYYYQGDYEKATDYYKKSIETFKKIGYKKELRQHLTIWVVYTIVKGITLKHLNTLNKLFLF